MFDSQSSSHLLEVFDRVIVLASGQICLFWNSGRDKGIFQSDSYAITEFSFDCV